MTPKLIASDTDWLPPGTAFRQPRGGPESTLVASFVEQLPFRLHQGLRHAIFREPRVGLAAPDLIYVAWRPDIVRAWPAARTQLRTPHYRLLQFLRTAGQSALKLPAMLRAEKRRQFGELETAGLISVRAGRVTLAPIDEAFAITRIIAIEAKVAKWRRVIEQAQANTWFASESYVLVPQQPRAADVVPLARRLGVGVWLLNGRLQRLALPRRLPLPVSFASWQINHWLIDL